MPDVSPAYSTPRIDGSDPRRDIARWARAIAGFAFLLLVVSAVSDWFIYQQYRIANDTQRDTREQLRAFVSLSGIIAGNVLDKDGKVTHRSVAIQLENSGGTRTARSRAWASLHYFDGNIPDSLDLSKPWTHIDARTLSLGAGAVTLLAPSTITEDEAEKANKKLGRVLLWGSYEYADIFNPGIVYPVSFCFVMEPTPTIDGGFTFSPVPYRDDCNKQQPARAELPQPATL
jgi:hypothetical protein